MPPRYVATAPWTDATLAALNNTTPPADGVKLRKMDGSGVSGWLGEFWDVDVNIYINRY